MSTSDLRKRVRQLRVEYAATHAELVATMAEYYRRRPELCPSTMTPEQYALKRAA